MASAFTFNADEILNRLRTPIIIKTDSDKYECVALWDTGATNSCISKDVINKLKLKNVGLRKAHTPSGFGEFKIYMVDVILPNNVVIPDLEVSESEIGLQGLGMLIGMDIMSKGDFALSNYNEKTKFTFRIPSKQHTDYVKEIKIEKCVGRRHGKGKRKKK